MIRIHILYEYGQDFRPHSSAFIRLLRPFSHPMIPNTIRVTWGRYLPPFPVDVVIVDRLWHPFDIDLASVLKLLKDIKNKKAKLFYAFDDPFEEWVEEKPKERAKYRDVFQAFLDSSEGILVTTPILASLYADRSPNIIVIPNMLDERLIARRSSVPKSDKRVVIGYMGTPTHDEDLEIILPVLSELHNRFPDKVLFEFIGVLEENTLHRFPILSKIPIHLLKPNPQQIEYPLFMLWFSSTVNWDIAIAPLHDTPFNRCKSDIKLLDYAALGAAGVFSEGPPYQHVAYGNKGLLVPNDPISWLEALTQLIVDPTLRYQIQNNAAHYLFTERILCKTADRWVKGIEDLLQGDSRQGSTRVEE